LETGWNALNTKSQAIHKSALLIAALVAILVTLIASVLALNLLPTYTNAYALFRYGDELVGIDLYGALAPLLLCLPLLSLKPGRSPTPGGSWLARRLFLISLGLACVLPLLPFVLVQESTGGLVLGTLGGALAIFLGGVLGAAYAILRREGISILQGSAECFVVSAVGSFVSDIIRTLSGLARAPGGVLIWGGGGSHDLVLWFGVYMLLSYLTFRLVYPRSHAFLARVRDRSIRSEVVSSQSK
jgi:hypothetical protein